MYSRLVGQEIDAEEEVVITVGAQQALYCTIFGMVNPGDEVMHLLGAALHVCTLVTAFLRAV